MCINYESINARIIFLLVVFFLFSFAEELPTTAFGLVLTQDLDVSPAIQTWYYTAAFTAFSFQPLFAIIAQTLSLYTFLKQKYFAITGIVIGGFMYVVIGSTKPNFTYLCVFTIILNVGLAFCNAIIDGIAVEISNYFKQKALKSESASNELNEPLMDNNTEDNAPKNGNCCTNLFQFGSAASIQSLSYFFRSCGSLSSAAMLIGLTNFDNYAAITLTGLVYLLIVTPFLILLFPKSRINLATEIEEADIASKHSKKRKTLIDELIKYWEIILQIWRCLLFVFFLNVPPTITDVFFTFIYDRYYFTKQQYRVFKFMGLVGSVLGGLIYFLFLSRYCENKRYLIWIFIIMQILNCIFGLAFLPLSNLGNSFTDDPSLNGVLGIPFQYAISGILLFQTLTSSLALMPQLTLAAQMSPLRLETSVFACFIGISHLGELLSSAISSALLSLMNIKEDHWQNLSHYVIICSSLGLLPLFGLYFIERVKTDEDILDDNDIQNDVIINNNKSSSIYVMENELVASDCSNDEDLAFRNKSMIESDDDDNTKMTISSQPDIDTHQ